MKSEQFIKELGKIVDLDCSLHWDIWKIYLGYMYGGHNIRCDSKEQLIDIINGNYDIVLIFKHISIGYEHYYQLTRGYKGDFKNLIKSLYLKIDTDKIDNFYSHVTGIITRNQKINEFLK